MEAGERYSRQILFREIGKEGQQKISSSRVLIVGCGALGAAHAESLARAGVGELRIIDRDFVEYSNLQRQALFDEEDASSRMPKAAAAKRRLAAVNSGVAVDAIVADLNASNIENVLKGCDLVLDGTDNFQTRYLVNDACVKLGLPWIYGAAVSSYGSTMTIIPEKTPCLRCIFPDMPEAGTSPTCDTAGVLMPVIDSISAIQVTEAMKLMVGDIQALHGSLIHLDVWRNDRRAINLPEPEPDCPSCGKHDLEFLDPVSEQFAAVLCGRNAVQIAPSKPTKLALDEFAERMMFSAAVSQNEYLVRFDVGDVEVTVFADARAIFKGIDNVDEAKVLYARYIGS